MLPRHAFDDPKPLYLIDQQWEWVERILMPAVDLATTRHLWLTKTLLLQAIEKDDFKDWRIYFDLRTLNNAVKSGDYEVVSGMLSLTDLKLKAGCPNDVLDGNVPLGWRGHHRPISLN